MVIKVFVVDDHALVRNGIAQVIGLESDLAVVGEGTGSSESVDAVVQADPDVAVIDLEMPGLRGAEFISRLRDRSCRAKTLVCSMHAAHGYVAEALRAGADGYVLKSSPSSLLVEGIRRVASGQGFIDPALQTDVIRILQHGDKGSLTAELTAQESEVLRLAAEGLTNHEIGRQTGQSVETVKLRLRRVFQKLGAADRANAVALALKRQLI